MSEDRLLNTLNTSKSIRKEDHYAGRILRKQELCLIQQKYKTIRETRKENPIEYIMLGNLDCTFEHLTQKKKIIMILKKLLVSWHVSTHPYVVSENIPIGA